MTGPQHEWESDFEYQIRCERDQERLAEDSLLRHFGNLAMNYLDLFTAWERESQFREKAVDPSYHRIRSLIFAYGHDLARADAVKTRRTKIRELNLKLREFGQQRKLEQKEASH